MSVTSPLHLAPPDREHVYLPGVSFATYHALVKEIEGHRHLRVTYYRGAMEIMSPSQNHERVKKLFGRMIETLTEVLDIPIMSVGSTTFSDELKECGLEPDECYYIQNEAVVRGKTIKLGEDPPPDLVLEVDITTSVIDRLPIYAEFGFPELWQYVDDEIVIRLLQKDGRYAVGKKSLALPMVSVKKLVEQMVRCESMNETAWIRQFRKWVGDGMN
jgi:Uma2 family endonuclease